MTDPRLAVITGSTSGIGLGIAKALALDGYQIILNGLGSADSIEQARQAVQSVSPYETYFIGTDLTDPNAIDLAVSELIENAIYSTDP
jgi:3-hydroxybutyrate dehydrogenase